MQTGTVKLLNVQEERKENKKPSVGAEDPKKNIFTIILSQKLSFIPMNGGEGLGRCTA
jgi:hypothetical protein